MRATNLRYDFVSALLVVGMMFFATPTMAVDGSTYEVDVVSSFGTKFSDCFRFDTSGNLVIDLLVKPQTFAHTNLDTHPSKWQSSSKSGDPLAIVFHGRTNESGKEIEGDAINEFGETFIFGGIINPDCVAGAAASKEKEGSGNPYSGKAK
jgi:hypothetical protein